MVMDHESDYQWKLVDCEEQSPVVCQFCEYQSCVSWYDQTLVRMSYPVVMYVEMPDL